MVADSRVKGVTLVSIPSEHQRHAMKPTRWVLFLRTFFLYQAIRFVWINLRMMKMIWMSHRSASTRTRSAVAMGPPGVAATQKT